MNTYNDRRIKNNMKEILNLRREWLQLQENKYRQQLKKEMK